MGQETMTQQLPELLQQLSEIEPEICEKYATNAFVIGDYIFGVPEDTGELVARHRGHDHVYTGPPAADWLAGALMRAIEARGWDYEYRFIAPIGNVGPRHKVTIFNGNDSHVADDKTTALLAAFVAACEAAKDGGR